MSYSRFSIASASPSGLHRMQFARKLTVIFCCSLIACLLAACGGSPAASNQPTLTPTPTFIPTPTDTPELTPTPTPQPPTPTPQPPAPTQPPSAPILDVAPSSMSIVGHLDCSKTTSVFVCQAAVISGASNQTALHWVAFANISGVGFNPSQGSLSPGTRVILTIKYQSMSVQALSSSGDRPTRIPLVGNVELVSFISSLRCTSCHFQFSSALL